MNFNKKHAASIALILILTIIPLHNLFSSTKIEDHIHYVDSAFFLYKSVSKQIFEDKSMFLWSPLEYSGIPLLGHPETFFISLPLLLILLLKNNTTLAVNLTLVISFFLAGLGMYFLFFELKRSKKAALIASIVFMLSGAVFGFGLFGNISVMVPLSMMPFVFLFIHKALFGKGWIMNAIIAALFASLQIHAGGMIMFLYTSILVGSYAVFGLFNKNITSRLIKTSIIMIIFVIFSVGLSAVKLLPTFEFQESSSRVSKFSYNEFLGGDGHQIRGSQDFFPNLIRGKRNLSVAPQIGIVSLLLILFSLYRIKNKKILFFTLMAIVSVLMAMDSFLTVLAYKFVPFYGNLKNIDRILVLFALSTAVLAGFGYYYLENYLERIKKIKLKKYIFPIILILLSVELMAIKDFPQTSERVNEKNIEILDFIAEDRDLFRVHFFYVLYSFPY